MASNAVKNILSAVYSYLIDNKCEKVADQLQNLSQNSLSKVSNPSEIISESVRSSLQKKTQTKSELATKVVQASESSSESSDSSEEQKPSVQLKTSKTIDNSLKEKFLGKAKLVQKNVKPPVITKNIHMTSSDSSETSSDDDNVNSKIDPKQKVADKDISNKNDKRSILNKTPIDQKFQQPPKVKTIVPKTGLTEPSSSASRVTSTQKGKSISQIPVSIEPSSSDSSDSSSDENKTPSKPQRKTQSLQTPIQNRSLFNNKSILESDAKQTLNDINKVSKTTKKNPQLSDKAPIVSDSDSDESSSDSSSNEEETVPALTKPLANIQKKTAGISNVVGNQQKPKNKENKPMVSIVKAELTVSDNSSSEEESDSLTKKTEISVIKNKDTPIGLKGDEKKKSLPVKKAGISDSDESSSDSSDEQELVQVTKKSYNIVPSIINTHGSIKKNEKAFKQIEIKPPTVDKKEITIDSNETSSDSSSEEKPLVSKKTLSKIQNKAVHTPVQNKIIIPTKLSVSDDSSSDSSGEEEVASAAKTPLKKNVFKVDVKKSNRQETSNIDTGKPKNNIIKKSAETDSSDSSSADDIKKSTKIQEVKETLKFDSTKLAKKSIEKDSPSSSSDSSEKDIKIVEKRSQNKVDVSKQSLNKTSETILTGSDETSSDSSDQVEQPVASTNKVLSSTAVSNLKAAQGNLKLEKSKLSVGKIQKSPLNKHDASDSNESTSDSSDSSKNSIINKNSINIDKSGMSKSVQFKSGLKVDQTYVKTPFIKETGSESNDVNISPSKNVQKTTIESKPVKLQAKPNFMPKTTSIQKKSDSSDSSTSSDERTHQTLINSKPLFDVKQDIKANKSINQSTIIQDQSSKQNPKVKPSLRNESVVLKCKSSSSSGEEVSAEQPQKKVPTPVGKRTRTQLKAVKTPTSKLKHNMLVSTPSNQSAVAQRVSCGSGSSSDVEATPLIKKTVVSSRKTKISDSLPNIKQKSVNKPSTENLNTPKKNDTSSSGDSSDKDIPRNDISKIAVLNSSIRKVGKTQTPKTKGKKSASVKSSTNHSIAKEIPASIKKGQTKSDKKLLSVNLTSTDSDFSSDTNETESKTNVEKKTPKTSILSTTITERTQKSQIKNSSESDSNSNDNNQDKTVISKIKDSIQNTITSKVGSIASSTKTQDSDSDTSDDEINRNSVIRKAPINNSALNSTKNITSNTQNKSILKSQSQLRESSIVLNTSAINIKSKKANKDSSLLDTKLNKRKKASEDIAEQQGSINIAPKIAKLNADDHSSSSFRRITTNVDELPEGLRNNDFVAKGKNDSGIKAQQSFQNLSGRQFKREKGKKKKGSFGLGHIDTDSRSFKFEDD